MNIAIVGLGLLGGSLARSIKKYTDYKVFAYDCNEETLQKGLLLNAYDAPLDQENIKSVDVLFMCLLPSQIITELPKYIESLKPGCIVSDITGTKNEIVKYYEKISKKYSNLFFISTHPMAGREFSGISHSSINLFERSYIIVVPVKSQLNELEKINNIFKKIGAFELTITNAKKHDEIISYTSQVAHVISCAYILDDLSKQNMGYSAGSFRDLSRVARLDSKMWSELMIENDKNLVDRIDVFINNLNLIKKAIKDGDKESLANILDKGSNRKIKLEKLKKEYENSRNKS